jgi:pimeloyl-ACP methyl ester carboxylesterase
METRLLSTRGLPDDHPAWGFLTGRTPFFAAQVDPRFCYAMYIPDGYRTASAPLPLLVATHGTGRRVERTRDLFVDWADEHGVAVLTPLFPGGIDDPNDLHNYKLIDFNGIRFDLILLSMVAEAQQRWNLAGERFLLAGFSGGGQFAHRFGYLHPDRLRAVSVGAPGRVTLPDAEPWPYGIADVADLFGCHIDFDQLQRLPVQVVVGADDSAAALLAAVATDGRERRAGATRLERASRLAAALRTLAMPVELEVVPGVAHDAAGVNPAVTEFLTRQLPPRD